MTSESGDLKAAVVHAPTIKLPARARDGSLQDEAPAIRLVLNVLLVALVCKVSIDIGFAHRLPLTIFRLSGR